MMGGYEDVIEPSMKRTVLPPRQIARTWTTDLMKFRSILSALFVSTLAAFIVALVVMRPIDQARAADITARCQGYERLTILLGNTRKVEGFSMRRCMDAIGRS